MLAAVDGDKVQLAAGVTADSVGKVKAGELVNFVAQQVGGKGGGKPDMAMAGGTDASKVPAALASVQAWRSACNHGVCPGTALSRVLKKPLPARAKRLFVDLPCAGVWLCAAARPGRARAAVKLGSSMSQITLFTAFVRPSRCLSNCAVPVTRCWPRRCGRLGWMRLASLDGAECRLEWFAAR